MQYDEFTDGSVDLQLSRHEVEQLEKFLHLSAMSLMTWPIVVGDFMSERKAERERRPEGADPPAA